MILYPAIDIKGGKAVRLLQGRKQDATIYGDPLDMAEKWAAQGAAWLHIVDLDGAFEGAAVNAEAVGKVIARVDIPVELGGGIRSLDDVRRWADAGVSRLILGTVAAETPQVAREAARLFPGRVAVGIDARDGVVMTRGWVGKSGYRAVELALLMKSFGIETVIYTDISKDGMMAGPNIPAIREMVEKTGMDITGSGGVSALSDITALKEAGCAGAILGKALYSGAFTLRQAMEVNDG